MESTAKKLQHLLQTLPAQITQIKETDLADKPTATVWSKKEILGHLIDSALHNLRRFVAAHYLEMPFAITAYEQDALVAANHYQELSTEHLLNLWTTLNQHILAVTSRLSTEQLADEVINPDEFKFLSVEQLFEEYVVHLEWHVSQITK